MRRFVSVVFLVLVATSVFADGVIIKCERPCTAATAAVTAAGGQVTHAYKYIDAIAAEVPRSGAGQLGSALPAGSVRKDFIVELPAATIDRNGTADVVEAGIDEANVVADDASSGGSSVEANGWDMNNTIINVQSLHNAGQTGANVRVAVIDSGLRPSFLVSAGAVIGGESLVPDALGFLNTANGPHGTFVSGMIGNRSAFNLTGHPWLPAIAANCPSCVLPGNVVRMRGSAPASRIYALRVFPPTGGAPESRIIAAMERVLTIRENFDNGMPETVAPSGLASSLNIKVCNMSLGGSTFHAGRDIEDQLTAAFLERDIVLVASAGNNGPGGSTGGSPGTGIGALTVGAASTAMHERILRGIQFGVPTGLAYRPTTATQTAYFSSRGPSADGRYSPLVTANGFASFSSNGGSGLSIGSGTSYSGPTVAGVAAVLRGAHPTATARQVRNAIVMTANPNVLGDNSTRNDMGFGMVDGAAASALLASGTAPDTMPSAGGNHKQVNVNITQGTNIQVRSGNVTESGTLLPGQRLETYYKIGPNTSQVIVTLTTAPGATQNALFGDDVIFSVHTAKTSAIGASGDYPVFAFSTGGSFVINNPDTGLMRVTATGDWTNASPIGATYTITSVSTSVPGNTSHAKIVEGDVVTVPFTVPAGAGVLTAHLEWTGDWGTYPTNDLDLILVPPAGPANVAGATLNSPERASIANPAAGAWSAIVDGFSIVDGDKYKLVVAIDGVVVK